MCANMRANDLLAHHTCTHTHTQLIRGVKGKQGASPFKTFGASKSPFADIMTASPFANKKSSWLSPSPSQPQPHTASPTPFPSLSLPPPSQADVGGQGLGQGHRGLVFTKSREALGSKAAAHYNTLLQAAHAHQRAVAAVLASSGSSDSKGAQIALGCWLDALALADDDEALQDSVLALGHCLQLV